MLSQKGGYPVLLVSGHHRGLFVAAPAAETAARHPVAVSFPPPELQGQPAQSDCPVSPAITTVLISMA